jgi:hypothetical protein
VGDQATNALIAIVLGSVLAVLLLIPTAAVQYRLDGRLGPMDLTILVTSAVYALAIWTYTLLPMPDGPHVPVQGQPAAGARVAGADPRPRTDGGPLALLREPAFLQIVLNRPALRAARLLPAGDPAPRGRGGDGGRVRALAADRAHPEDRRLAPLLVCVPALRRRRPHRQHPRRPRSARLLSLLVVRRRTGKIVLPTTISFGRRLVGFTCDVLFIALAGAAAALAYRGFEIYLRDVRPLDVDRHVQAAVQWGVPFAVETVLVLGFGRTVGEWVVSLHTVPRRRGCSCPAGSSSWPSASARSSCSRRSTNQVVGPVAIALLAAYAVLTVVVAWRTRTTAASATPSATSTSASATTPPRTPSAPPTRRYP